MAQCFYSESIETFIQTDSARILGILTNNNQFELEQTQKDAWVQEICMLKQQLQTSNGFIFFEFSVPRIGSRIDVVVIIESVLFILEFKVGEKHYPAHAIDQVWDYALDLKNFHQTSHDVVICPILIATEADQKQSNVEFDVHNDKVFRPIKSNGHNLLPIIESVLSHTWEFDSVQIDGFAWSEGQYCPSPTIIEAALTLYREHSVKDITRNDASAINLTKTSNALLQIIEEARRDSKKCICFVTGVPGAGKTLVGLNIATYHMEKSDELRAVFLSGNGPLVRILVEALARDRYFARKLKGQKVRKDDVRREVKAFIQAVHHYRDEYLNDAIHPPADHVAIFDEAQRAWNKEQTSSFMIRKRKRKDFNISEPEFLISCLDRHKDWAVMVCLVGGGQEINTGEAGISEWLEALCRSYPEWEIYISDQLKDSEYAAGRALEILNNRPNVAYCEDLHLSVSMRSFRAERVSTLIKQLLDRERENACVTLRKIGDSYPIALTRSIKRAKQWLLEKSRGSERFGIIASSQADRLKPFAIDVNSKIDPVHWFLDEKMDIRSSFYMEGVATEFDVQGLELDWVCVAWDADLRYSNEDWIYKHFMGSSWRNHNKPESKTYLKNAYRVLLTRARQGMIIFIPEGDPKDPTRKSSFYDPTFEYLKSIGFDVIN